MSNKRLLLENLTQEMAKFAEGLRSLDILSEKMQLAYHIENSFRNSELPAADFLSYELLFSYVFLSQIQKRMHETLCGIERIGAELQIEEDVKAEVGFLEMLSKKDRA